jgi:hypothetical protein
LYLARLVAKAPAPILGHPPLLNLCRPSLRPRISLAPRAFPSIGCTALNLKRDAIRSDTGLMIFSAHSAPARSATQLLSVRRSLNTPVLAIAQLPVGPASAAIAAHVDSRDGLPRYTLAVRSARSRGVVFFTAREEDLARSESSLAAESALSLAEGMGFLFEEDLPVISGKAAARIWEEFVDSADPSAGVADQPAMPLLTKFRRAPSWSAAGSASVIASGAAPHGVASGAEAGLEPPDRQIAPPGDR